MGSFKSTFNYFNILLFRSKELSDDLSVHVFMKNPNNKDIINGLPSKSICKYLQVFEVPENL